MRMTGPSDAGFEDRGTGVSQECRWPYELQEAMKHLLLSPPERNVPFL